jgi:hypothetical protein
MTTLTTDEAIQAAAAARYGSVRVSVVRYNARHTPYSAGHTNGDVADANEGQWFVLSIDRGAGFEVVMRRRTKIELWRTLTAQKAI